MAVGTNVNRYSEESDSSTVVVYDMWREMGVFKVSFWDFRAR